MIEILGSQRRLCGGVTRRDWLQIGGLGMLGVGLQDYVNLRRLQAASSLPGFGKAKSCILLLPYGSPPQHETFDPKPDAPAEVRGIYKPASTSVPGVQICDGLPKISRVMDRLTVIRSMTHPYPLHCTAYVTSGIPDYTPELETRPRDPRHWPYVGSIVDYVEERRQAPAGIPRNIALPWKMNSRGGEAASVEAGPYAAFLGRAYDPVLTDFNGKGVREIVKQRPYGTRHQVLDPYAGISPQARFSLRGVQLDRQVTLDRHLRRRSLLEQFSAARRALDDRPATRNLDRFRRMAYSLLASPQINRALDVQQESARTRESFGMTLFGQSCLVARRLIEAGGKFVTVFWDEYAYLNTDWDTHWNQNHRLKGWLLPGFDAAFSGLILDLEQRGMLDETLVVWMSEHGRTPRFNSNAGRDHWSRVYSIAMAGGGIRKGEVIGRSDSLGGDVLEHGVSPKDILATILHLLGIDAHMTVPNQVGQPMPVAGTGQVRYELFA